MSSIEEIERLEALFEELKGGLDFYSKFVNTTNPKHRGIPFMAASDNFSTSTLHNYGKFWRLFKKITQAAGLTSLWDRAIGYGGWIFHHRKAMGILFPRSPDKIKMTDDVPTLVQDKITKDPERAKKALPHFQSMIDLIERDLNDLSTTVRGDPQLTNPGEDVVMEAVINRIWRKHVS
jgi:hypothetical protein